MKLDERYIEILNLGDFEWNSTDIRDKKIFHINDDCKKSILEDIVKIDISYLYTNILIGLFNEGLIDSKWKDDIERVHWFLENRRHIKSLSSSTEYLEWRIHCNSLYGKIKTPLVVEYMNLFYTELIEKWGDKIIYIDVDMILHDRSIDIDSHLSQFQITKSSVEYFYMENLKKYIIYSQGEFEHKGFRDNIRREELFGIIKSEIRNMRLNKIGL